MCLPPCVKAPLEAALSFLVKCEKLLSRQEVLWLWPTRKNLASTPFTPFLSEFPKVEKKAVGSWGLPERALHMAGISEDWRCRWIRPKKLSQKPSWTACPIRSGLFSPKC